MKKIIFSIILPFIFVLAFLSCNIGNPSQPNLNETSDGSEWICATSNADFSTREHFYCVSFNNKIWVIGGVSNTGSGDENKNDVWCSSNGIDWSHVSTIQDLGATNRGGAVVYDNKIWVLSGNGMWLSENGIDWSVVTKACIACPQTLSKVIDSFNKYSDKFWSIGGYNGITLNDVWSSVNGVDWELTTGNADFDARFGHASVEFNGKLYVIAGENSPGNTLSDVWNTTSGVDWLVLTINASFGSRKGHEGIVYDNKIWVIGGEVLVGNDVWFSEDGVDWICATGNAEFGGRSYFASVIHRSKMWVIGGRLHGGGRSNDVWHSK